ncbi:TPA: hypothetical protein SAY52_005789 [Burkholderia cenocepacia]|uniref:hypothetical protein n=1 Tax=unclassified Burkholderia TaxID=2613784 RepID=UPI001589B58E|nr:MULTISPECIES: hypothetical protein [unclassified Burkholderia]HEF5875097.1 hypothetical protein [Burkholderia cenocepacia]
MATYDLYGFSSADMDKAKSILEAALDIQFEVHGSSYHGDRYFKFGEVASEHFVLKRNVDPFDDEPVEIAYPEHAVLFYVNDTSRSADLQEIIAQKADGFILLRHEQL